MTGQGYVNLHSSPKGRAMFEHLKVDKRKLATSVREIKAVATKRGVDAHAMVSASLSSRIRRDPMAYLTYCPYWWSCKRTARPYRDFGDIDDELIRCAYCAGDPVSDIAAGFLFVDYTRIAFMPGHRHGTFGWWLGQKNRAHDCIVLRQIGRSLRRRHQPNRALCRHQIDKLRLRAPREPKMR